MGDDLAGRDAAGQAAQACNIACSSSVGKAAPFSGLLTYRNTFREGLYDGYEKSHEETM